MKNIRHLIAALLLLLFVSGCAESDIFQQQSEKNSTIQIKMASYGDGAGWCDKQVIEKNIKKMCEGEESCSFKVYLQLCDGKDPLPSHKKTLRVSYSCGEGSREVANVDYENMKLECPMNTTAQ